MYNFHGLLKVSSSIENVTGVDGAAVELEIISLENDLYYKTVAEPKSCLHLIPREK